MALRFLKNQFWADFPAPTGPDLSGRTVVITGANVGLGLETAYHLARLHAARLILPLRSVEKGEAAAELIVEKTGYDRSSIEVWQLDLSSFESVSALGKRLVALDRLDVLILNAGVYATIAQVNVLSTGLLVILALPILRKTAGMPLPCAATDFKPHLTIVSSEMHEFAKFKEGESEKGIFEAMKDESFFSQDRYNSTKLLDVFLANELAVREPLLQVNSVNPSFCYSELGRGMTDVVFSVLQRILAWPAEKGARTIATAAIADFPTGEYISTCQVTTPGSTATSEKAKIKQAKAWDEMVAIWKEVDGNVAAILA